MPPARWRRALLPLLAALAVPLLVPSTSYAEPISAVRARIAALDNRVSMLTEQFNQSREQLKAAQRRSAALADEVARERASVARQRAQLDAFVAAAYRLGVNQDIALLTSDSPQTFLDQASSLEVISNQQAAALQDLQAGRHRLANAELTANRQLAAQRRITQRIATARSEVSATLAAQHRLLASLQAQQRAALAAAARADAAAALAQRGTYDGPASGPARAALQFAYAQLGKPYQWGGAGPNSYDCSGLTMASWAAAGVSLPHSAEMQREVTRPVSDLRPGDLIFFGDPAYHVGMYVGDGKMIEAPHTGDVVKVIGVGHYTAAGRP